MPGNRNGDSYSFQSLQEDAVRRAREMQARAHLSPFEAPGPAGNRPSEPQPRPYEERPSAGEQDRPVPPPSQPPPGPEEPADHLASGLLDSLLKDNERTLIWVLLLILLEEKADTALIFALMYLAT
ncbi:hypothetical protein CAFE_28690 [Caprobacter fermentans]|uniref:Uncharacterized protein n=1 Tax=Caproicibacter fermentans TaxID=2576756 RepID=A0A6N8I308_9FIRM|nr:hypothetical protein [Caproicibacter fermentans]MVB12137.1 hypothetical protein [Caproicibacter fermentans]OCN01211.1 hypothetical protein A7X67_07525 [Clostridium sp. W14A]QNK39567.1 hypothetical protein HCR03_12555 [Caproicibacter fermentans]